MSADIKSRKLIPIGIVLALIGTVVVIGVDSVKRILGIGDKLNQGDNLASGENGEIIIGFADTELLLAQLIGSVSNYIWRIATY